MLVNCACIIAEHYRTTYPISAPHKQYARLDEDAAQEDGYPLRQVKALRRPSNNNAEVLKIMGSCSIACHRQLCLNRIVTVCLIPAAVSTIAVVICFPGPLRQFNVVLGALTQQCCNCCSCNSKYSFGVPVAAAPRHACCSFSMS